MPSGNLFLLGRRPSDEDQLTSMLVWLAVTVPEVRRALVELAVGTQHDPRELEVKTQHSIPGGRLDALIRGPGLRIGVESKLGSTYGDDQVARYLRWLAERKSSVSVSALMTLTARPAPWRDEDARYADTTGILRAARLWEELHDILQPLVADGADEPLASRLVGEFLEMLEKEGLVPVRPMTTDELGTRWADSWRVVRRFSDFFSACKEAIASDLSATQLTHRWSNRGDWIYQDYALADGSSIVVGLGHTDEHEKVPVHQRTPILWIGVMADHLADWPTVAEALTHQRPSGWYPGNDWFGRPTIWCYLADVIGGDTFELQRERLAAKAAEGPAWLDQAKAADDGQTASTRLS